MKARLGEYKKEGKLALKHMWYVVAFFGLIQCIVSIIVAVYQKGEGGYPSATFAAIWSMFLCILFTIHGAQIVFGGVSSELGVGFMIGVAAMMTQLFFVLMCVFFVLATEAQTAGYASAPADIAYGVFCLFNMIIYFVYAIILSMHRRSVIASPQEVNYQKEVVTPDQDGGVDGDYQGDEVEL
mmetsp:Transcript_35537/g.33708  ORF Transcript_35537/g.33708 Transcript_35537/m.33708 type:complete len:183 (+) Transcript_35537:100-648(+)|eukprot:CAMPEP_0119041906 /NCGR_PEP_ID=MMETSP1177-20130426/14192_1 /TAXON_ID=2985 /ORGANISM="Ochromonas sp, Strain CCMP1899" /LENGTH=182 /DNA_ID=CAMNT_0007008319 /DNA_START=100 /DNA_END=648 /DNA_ORIENTATION=-